jgi:hypothetical protein
MVSAPLPRAAGGQAAAGQAAWEEAEA